MYVPLDVHPDRGERVDLPIGTPLEEDPQVGLGVDSGLSAVAAQVRGDRGSQDELVDRYDIDAQTDDSAILDRASPRR
ncbi:hypothetical protein KRMM14A1259_61320 [Krasilnikovia sp. MM14-A1259]